MKPVRALALLLAVALVSTLVTATPALAAPANACQLAADPANSFVGGTAADGIMTTRLGCARDSGALRSLAASDNDLMVAFDFQGDDRSAYVAGVARDINAAPTLTGYLQAQAAAHDLGLYPHPVDALAVDGTAYARGNSLILVVPAGQVSTTSTWWQKVVAVVAGFAAQLVATAACVALILELAPPLIPYVDLVCNNLGNFLGGLVGELVNAVFDERSLGDGDVWAEAVAVGLAAVVGVPVLKQVAAWLKTAGRTMVTSFRNGIRYCANRLGWGRGEVATIGEGFNDFELPLWRAVDRAGQEGAGALRIMPLGDSITQGVGSSAMNGYRVPLQQQLARTGTGFDFVGSQSDGVSTADTQHEGHSGWRIDEIAARLPDWLTIYRPRVITLHLGTNDMIQNYQTGGAVDRLGGVIDQIYAGVPAATVVLTSLVPSRTAAIDARIRQFNLGLRDMVRRRTENGKHLIYLDLSVVTTADIADDVHPNDAGYAKMAKVFSLGVLSAVRRGWLDGADVPSTATCSPADAGGGGPRQARFADLNGDGRDDYLAVDPATGSVRTWLNIGADRDGDHWMPCGITASGTNTGVGLSGREVQFADLDGNGRDDYLAVDPATGSVRAWLNDRGYQSGDHWIDRGIIASGSNTGVGYYGRQVRFADLNGDGRADYLAVDAVDGSVRGWLNNGAEQGGDRWIDKGVIASGVNTGVGAFGRQIQFADLNGDGRVEYLAVEPADGSVHAWLNNGAENGGDRWIDQGIIASGTNTGVGTLGRQVAFGDLNGDHLADYLALDPLNGSTHGWINVRAHVSGDNWLYRGVIASGTNTGVGPLDGLPPIVSVGFGQAAFADLDGDTRDDYLAVDVTDGAVAAWINNGAAAAGDHWIGRGIIASGINTGVGIDGREVRWADLDGDGRDDYVAVDPRNGLAQAWLNNGAAVAGDHWLDRGIVASGAGTGVGSGAGASEARFADLDGDGRDDYLAVNQHNGSVHLWLNAGADRAGDRWVDQGVIASGVNTGVRDNGPQVAFADLDGDGKDDYLAVDPNNGSVHAWLNRGAHTTGDHWLDRGVIASGSGTGVAIPGRQVHLADLDAGHRADYLAVDPANGNIRAWRNDGADTSGDHWISLGGIATGNGTNNGAGNGAAGP